MKEQPPRLGGLLLSDAAQDVTFGVGSERSRLQRCGIQRIERLRQTADMYVDHGLGLALDMTVIG